MPKMKNPQITQITQISEVRPNTVHHSLHKNIGDRS
jgi:hypothetical protein